MFFQHDELPRMWCPIQRITVIYYGPRPGIRVQDVRQRESDWFGEER